ncbi:MAG: hypothetical protein IT380_27745 [Myxococcales bacterium]|nr:hypothetical protein [Myxococcales bacterium]
MARRAEPSALATGPRGYAEWLAEVKARSHAAQQRAALAVNRELLALYWRLGRDILERQAAGAWGDGILDRVSRDLRASFPGMRGFSRSNLKYMRAFAEAWPAADFGQQPVGQLLWGHNLVLLTKLKDPAAQLRPHRAVRPAGVRCPHSSGPSHGSRSRPHHPPGCRERHCAPGWTTSSRAPLRNAP